MEQPAMLASAKLEQDEEACEGVRSRILVVEDDADTMNWLSVLLKQNQFHVYKACDGTQALSMAVRERPDLMILDIGLPAGNGIFVLENIRRNESLCRTPVIVWSGAPGLRPQEAMEAGATCFLPKPCSNESILHAVESAILTAEHYKTHPAAERTLPAGAEQPPD